jgi:hypothetical protein
LQLTILIDEFPLATFALRAGEPFERVLELPAACGSRSVLCARFEASDYAYVGPDLQHCVSAQLERVALE